MTGKDTMPVKSGEGLNEGVLEAFIRQHIEGIPEGRLEIEQFWAGHSNLTYQLKIDDWEAVLRRPPLGPVAPKAHDMKREHRILSEISPLFSQAPKPLLFSEDESIVGSPFFLMERKHGIVLDTSFPEGIEATEELCSKLSHLMVDRLVELHSIDYKKTGLTEISSPAGFMERQVHGWIGRYERAKTDEIKEAEALKKWLSTNLPKSQPPVIIHYDYKLNNAMFSEDLTAMVGLFDWEMSTVGDPLADLGAAMSYWMQEDDPALLKNGLGKPSLTIQKGFLTRRAFIESYAKKSGRDVSDIGFYLTFAYFKLAVICQQIYYRYKKGQTNDARFSHFDQFVKSLIVHAASISTKH
ncbi:phosphotransferase family protein [Jeotgalibacillus proteolyticus]|uniref:Phosphotransferase family protein n=1 Tax=Jeotgalibacillus proteolyticus TaxID=2082395 RepID=A0A2S5G8Q0_9BACL|nr:phosphotransferase family protein [Jeotgalibacillus proteolyticus]PPA69291.1 phosphotransferase family protein [Jeotgalibacillus proteolyticus]